LLVLAFFAALTAPAAHARTRHSDAWAREHFAAADRMREALNGRPPADRTRHDYQRVIDAYRSVYLGAPTSTKADPSVVAVAETLVEMGRRFDDDKILNKAIEQYKFLRREYPGSKYRFDGLFTIGEIYKDDLNDPAAARATFQDFVRHYPHNRLADDARQAIVELNQEEKAENSDQQQAAEKRERESGKNGSLIISKKDTIGAAAESHSVRAASDKDKDESPPRSDRLPRVTGIRHWSTPDYTRVAIDVESDVKFSSQRIARPSRIFFDLRDTKLASTLVGKSFDVDDGFLKKVRVAQFAPGRTRVVLEVDNLSDYDAFLLPNPYRLIIDIHGKNGRTKQARDVAETQAEADAEAPAKTAPEYDGSGSLEAKSAASEPPAPQPSSLKESGNTSPERQAAGDGATASPAKISTVSKKAHPAVVKKIVEADGGDTDNDQQDGSLPAGGAAKQNNRATKQKVVATARNTVDAKKPVDGDLDNGPDNPDPVATEAGQRSPSDTQRRSSRALASNKLGSASGLDIREARPTASGDRSLIRALGLKIGKIVIDPGHGGHDTGTIGPNGLEEKDLVLEVGRRLGKLLETRLGAEVVYTRKDDTFIPLETRTAIANQARADLFVSIHANSSHDPDARGVETYYLNFTSSPEALEVAARENAVSEKSIYELQDLVKKIALKEKIEESREFAGDVQQSLHSGLALKSPAIRDRGVKKAPFIVLIGANMPSILAEISFVSNPTDEHRLATSEYRERIAESLYRGIAKYVNGLSGVKVASKMDKGAGQ
jgi:N-acetylmuramoyl-L-alanine amidase